MRGTRATRWAAPSYNLGAGFGRAQVETVERLALVGVPVKHRRVCQVIMSKGLSPELIPNELNAREVGSLPSAPVTRSHGLPDLNAAQEQMFV